MNPDVAFNALQTRKTTQLKTVPLNGDKPFSEFEVAAPANGDTTSTPNRSEAAYSPSAPAEEPVPVNGTISELEGSSQEESVPVQYGTGIDAGINARPIFHPGSGMGLP